MTENESAPRATRAAPSARSADAYVNSDPHKDPSNIALNASGGTPVLNSDQATDESDEGQAQRTLDIASQRETAQVAANQARYDQRVAGKTEQEINDAEAKAAEKAARAR